MKCKGYNGYEFEPKVYGWIADQDGRSGTVKEINCNLTKNICQFVIETSYGIDLVFECENVSYYVDTEEVS